MNADKLEMPAGLRYAVKVDGMREILQYDINLDAFCARWDTIINDKQYHIFDWQTNVDKAAEDWIVERRPFALEKFKAMDKSIPC